MKAKYPLLEDYFSSFLFIILLINYLGYTWKITTSFNTMDKTQGIEAHLEKTSMQILPTLPPIEYFKNLKKEHVKTLLFNE